MQRFFPYRDQWKYHIIIVISLDLVSMSTGAGGVAWGRSGEATGAERRAARASLWAGGGAQWAGTAAQPGPPGTAGAGDPSGAAPTAGLRLRARGTTPARGPLRCTGMSLDRDTSMHRTEIGMTESQWHTGYTLAWITYHMSFLSQRWRHTTVEIKLKPRKHQCSTVQCFLVFTKHL